MKLMGSLRQFERLIDRLSVVIRCNLVAASGVRSTFRSPHFWFVFWNRRHARPMLRSPRGSCNIMPLSAWAEASALAAGHRHEKAAAGLRSAAASIRISDHQKGQNDPDLRIDRRRRFIAGSPTRNSAP